MDPGDTVCWRRLAFARKHKVTFEVAKTVFYNDFAVQSFDEEHSSREDRFYVGPEL